jgi:hypothetical protein
MKTLAIAALAGLLAVLLDYLFSRRGKSHD